jgi:hypothetical protein
MKRMPRPGRYRRVLERLGRASLQELAQFRCCLKLRDGIQFLKRRRERIREAPDRPRLEFLVLRFEIQIMHSASQVLRGFELALHERLVITTLAVTSVSSLLCHASTCFCIGSKFRCIRSTPTEMQSISENDLECFASTGVKSPLNAMFEHTNTR